MNNDFPYTICSFLADLQANNSREWFEANRKRYENEWIGPATAFVSALSEPMEALSPSHKAVPKVNGSIRRIHRDTRFSKDKTPFDPKLHLVFWTGDHPNRSPAIHLVLHPDRLGFGAGQFAMTAEELAAYRTAISNDDGARESLKAIIADLERLGCALTPETLKRLPSGFELANDDATLLKRKGLVVKTVSDYPPAAICDKDRMSTIISELARLDDWLVRHVTKGQ